MSAGVEVQRACVVPDVPSPAKIAHWAGAALSGRSEGAEMTVRQTCEIDPNDVFITNS